MGRKEGNKLVFNALSTMTVISGREKDQTDRDRNRNRRWGGGEERGEGACDKVGALRSLNTIAHKSDCIAYSSCCRNTSVLLH